MPFVLSSYKGFVETMPWVSHSSDHAVPNSETTGADKEPGGVGWGGGFLPQFMQLTLSTVLSDRQKSMASQDY